MRREDVCSNEMSISAESSYVAAMCRNLAYLDVKEMPGIESLTSREINILVENRTAELLHNLAVSVSEQVMLRRKYA